MREIIFRGKQRDLAHEQFPQKHPKLEREFVYGTGIYNDGANLWLVLENNENKTFSQLKSTIIDPETLGQFINAYDKDDEKLFDCDIVKIFTIKWIVAVIKIEFGMPIFYSRDFEDGYDLVREYLQIDREYGWVDCEVIGNIHEHKHLLDGEENQ